MNGRDIAALAKRINLSELARSVGVSAATIYAWANRGTELPADMSKALATEMLKLAADLRSTASSSAPESPGTRTGKAVQRRPKK